MGLNRDKENLPQINLGMVCCKKTGLPFFDTIFPGSIVDVKTIINFVKYLKIYKLQDLFLILDRGFFSISNICELIESDRNLSLIIPLPFTLKVTKEEVLSFYRDKDKVEKIFDSTKNELNTNRLHAHSKTTTEGRLFVKFIAIILYQQITKIMRENELFKKYSVTELLKELSKIKMIAVPKVEPFTTECSKAQTSIFAKFNIKFST